MARRPNYGAEKRQKEIQRQKKKDEKAEKQRLRKEAAANDPSGAEAGDDGELDSEDAGSDADAEGLRSPSQD